MIRLPFQLQRQQVILIVGIAMALVAIVMIKVYLDQQRIDSEKRAKEKYEKIQASQTSVLIAKREIPRGAALEPDSLEVKVIPNQFVQPGAVTSLDRVSGMTVLASISKGEQIILSKLSYQRAGDLAAATPVGKRAITISVDNVASLAGLIRAGDYVDVVAMLPIPSQGADGKTVMQLAALPLFQNVLVVAVGQETQAAAPTEAAAGRYKTTEAKREASSLITLALSPQEASFIAFVQEQGKIRLLMRSPTDAKVENIQPASWETLSQYLMPKGKKDEPQARGYVEIYRGLNKERVPLYK